jgi:type III pantothenate kinase
MNLIIDEGNTNIKLGAFAQDKLQWTETYQSIPEVMNRLRTVQIERVLLSSVKDTSEWLQLQDGFKIEVFDSNTPLPIKIDYHSRETLGTDRIAAACGAFFIYPGQNCLIFDLGTCLTHGFIDKNGVFYGGSISPGMEMRFKALHQFTARLPYLGIEQEVLTTGNSTKSSIISGVINGIVFEINGFIEFYQNKYSEINVLITGGNMLLFEKRLKQPIFAVTELNLTGLNRILKYNV